jgi:hypothetical protein
VSVVRAILTCFFMLVVEYVFASRKKPKRSSGGGSSISHRKIFGERTLSMHTGKTTRVREYKVHYEIVKGSCYPFSRHSNQRVDRSAIAYKRHIK